MVTFFPIKSEPDISPSKEMSLSKNSNLRAHSLDTIHFSPSTVIFLYIVSGLTQRFVTPKIVSGRSVAVGMM